MSNTFPVSIWASIHLKVLTLQKWMVISFFWVWKFLQKLDYEFDNFIVSWLDNVDKLSLLNLLKKFTTKKNQIQKSPEIGIRLTLFNQVHRRFFIWNLKISNYKLWFRTLYHFVFIFINFHFLFFFFKFILFF